LIGFWPSINERLDYIDAMVAGGTRFFLSDTTTVNLKWRDERSLRTCINIERSKIADAYDRMLNSLVEGKYLTPEEARGLPLKLTLHVYDSRAKRSEPLPTNLEPNVNPNREPRTQRCELGS